MISLYAWSKLYGIPYSRAQKLFARDELAGAVKDGWNIMVPPETKPKETQNISCGICGKHFPQMTSSHLKTHGETFISYREKFPGRQLVSDELLDVISVRSSTRYIPPEVGRKISAAKKGKPSTRVNYVPPPISEETREKMRSSHTGLKHTDEAKAKIGDAHRGIPETEEAKASIKAGLVTYYKENESALKGRKHTDATRANMAVAARKREAEYSPERRAELIKARADGVRGTKRTPEQKERYRRSRVKWMQNNPLKVANTKGELAIKAWLEERLIFFVQQYVVPGTYHPYDFYIPSYNTIIEFDGPHHWRGPWFKVVGTTPEHREERLQMQRAKDAKENLAAGRAGHKVVRILGCNAPGDSGHGTFEEQLAEQGFVLKDSDL